MADNSRIQWTEATWNPVAGCSICSPGCNNCYAQRMARRLEAMGQEKYTGLTQIVKGKPVWNGVMRLWEPDLDTPLDRKKPELYFVNSMSDLFHENLSEESIAEVFAVMALAYWHRYQVLTKRAARMRELLSAKGFWHRVRECINRRLRADRERYPHVGLTETLPCRNPLPNVWLGVSVERQREAEERIPHLIETPAAIRFLSCEPLLGPLYLGHWFSVWEDQLCERRVINWAIVGTESGPGKRPLELPWARSIVEQCRAAGVAAFVKQLPVNGRVSHDPEEWPTALRVREMPGHAGAGREG